MIIPKSDVPVFFNNKSFVSEQNILLLWRADLIQLDNNIDEKISKLRSRE